MDPRLQRYVEAAARGGLFLDFDGTLSEIVDEPGRARPVANARDLLEQLSHRFALVAVVSGRSAHELLDWLGSEIEIWGVHGAERTRGGDVLLSDWAAVHEGVMSEAKADASRRLEELGIPGALFEDKGIVATIHYRMSPDPEETGERLRRLVEGVAERHGVWWSEGKRAFEIRPPVELSKKRVVATRVRELALEAGAFVGDDVVDLPAFDALDELEGEGFLALRVAVDSPEAPPELLERADVVVDGPAGVVALLERLAA